MTNDNLLESAKKAGFAAAIISPDQIPVNPDFHDLCEKNLCGQILLFVLM